MKRLIRVASQIPLLIDNPAEIPAAQSCPCAMAVACRINPATIRRMAVMDCVPKEIGVPELKP